jgi:hypothetical protein
MINNDDLVALLSTMLLDKYENQTKMIVAEIRSLSSEMQCLSDECDLYISYQDVVKVLTDCLAHIVLSMKAV